MRTILLEGFNIPFKNVVQHAIALSMRKEENMNEFINLLPEDKRDAFKAAIKADKSAAIQKRISKVKSDEDIQAKLDKLAAYETAEKEAAFKATIDEASEGFNFLEGKKDKAIKLADIADGDDLETIKEKISTVSKEYDGILFGKTSDVGTQVNKLQDPATDTVSTNKIHI